MSPKLKEPLPRCTFFVPQDKFLSLLQGSRLQHLSHRSRIFYSFQKTAIWRSVISFEQAEKATASIFHVPHSCALKNTDNRGRKETSAPSLPGAGCEILHISLKIALLHKVHPVLLHGNCSITTDHDSPLLNVPLSWCDSDNNTRGNLTLPSTRSSLYKSPFSKPSRQSSWSASKKWAYI